MTDRVIRIASRAFVIACGITALAAIGFATSVLSHGSGTFFARLIALPLIVAPGALVWWQPRARWFAVWGMVAAFVSILLLILGNPYRSEEELRGWSDVEATTWFTIAITVVGSTVAAFLLAARAPRTGVTAAEPLASNEVLARRLRRVVQLVTGIAVAISCFAFLPGERVYAGNEFLYESSAGGFYVIGALALVLLPAILVYRDPRKRWAWLWFVWTLPASLLLVVASVGIHILSTGVDLWPRTVVKAGAFTILVLILIAVPLIALLTRERPGTSIPPARVR